MKIINCDNCGGPIWLLNNAISAICMCGHIIDIKKYNNIGVNNDSRKSWDSYFMDIAYVASTRATCPRRHVGAVLTKDKKVLGTGYNGAPSHVPSCLDEGCMMHHYVEINNDGVAIDKEKCIRTIHAEQNLLLFTDQNDRKDATLYVTDQPCWSCANMIANSGVTEVVYHRGYIKDFDKVNDLFTRKKIILRELKDYTPPEGSNMKVTE